MDEQSESKNINHDIKTFSLPSAMTIDESVQQITEFDKSRDPDHYIVNPKTGRYVKKNTPRGRQLMIDSGLIPRPKTKNNKPSFAIHRVSRDNHSHLSDNFPHLKPKAPEDDNNNCKINLIGKRESITKGQEILRELRTEKKNGQPSSLIRGVPERPRHSRMEEKERDDQVLDNSNSFKERRIKKIIFHQPPPVDKKEKSPIKIMYIYTDGAVSNNQSGRGSGLAVGGIGVYFGSRDPRNISERFKEYPVTNQRAEIWAIVRALQTIIKHKYHLKSDLKMIIFTDSMYAMNVITGEWNAKQNMDLVAESWKLMKQAPNIEIKHVRGHSKKKDTHSIGNTMADELARKGKLIS